MKKEIGKILRACRITHHFTQEYVAFKLGITATSYANIEHGRVELTMSKLCMLASLFKLQAHQIVALAEETIQHREYHFLPGLIQKISRSFLLLK